MSRNVFISFLGATQYKPCRYYFEGYKESPLPVESFVQAALLGSMKHVMGELDCAYIFLTKLAEDRNWKDNGHKDRDTNSTIISEGLNARLSKLRQTGDLIAQVEEKKEIPEGYSSEEMWAIFVKINEVLQEDDNVYLDVTNAFRHIPMLVLSAMVLEKANKNIILKAIYYGIFEAQDPVNKEVNRAAKLEYPLVPILNLLSIEQLQQWSMATYDFEKNGNASLLAELTIKEINPLLAESKGLDEPSKKLKELIKSIYGITNNINTNRGLKIGEYSGIKSTVDILNFFSKGVFIKPMEVLLSKIELKIKELFLPDHFPSWLKSAKWCLKHKLIQQGLTQLNEGIVTYVVQELEPTTYLRVNKYLNRALVGICLQKASKKESMHSLEDDYGKELIRKITGTPGFRDFSTIYQKLNDNYRNDINHAGYRFDARNAAEFEAELAESIKRVEIFFNAGTVSTQEMDQRPLKFINISNHPMANWSKEQIAAAIEYGEGEDLAFPMIHPEANSEDIDELANEYLNTVIEMQNNYDITIHLMGESTFCFALIKKLKSIGIKVLASTTNRVIIEEGNGKKTTQFNFVKFREY